MAKRKLRGKAIRRPKARRIDARYKGRALAVEPPIDGNAAHLFAEFNTRLQAALAELAQANTPFRLVEGFRSTERQQWLYGSGRPSTKPYGRPGPVVTNADGVAKRSNHQGDGVPGSGKAADCYPMRNGKVYIPPSSDAIWAAYAQAVEAQGLVAGHYFKSFKDSPHCELP